MNNTLVKAMQDHCNLTVEIAETCSLDATLALGVLSFARGYGIMSAVVNFQALVEAKDKEAHIKSLSQPPVDELRSLVTSGRALPDQDLDLMMQTFQLHAQEAIKETFFSILNGRATRRATDRNGEGSGREGGADRKPES